MIKGKHIIQPENTIEFEFRTEYFFEISTEIWLDEVFDNIPSNSIINKGRCGIGGTYLEIKAKRNSILIVPTNAIIDNKCFDIDGNLKDGYFVARGANKNFDFTALREFMLDDTKFKKIFCTPESLSKICKCGYALDILYSEWFILFDEAHATITDNYRIKMLGAFDYFFQFDNKALISSTPYDFSSPQFESLDIYNIKFNEPIGTVEVISTMYVIDKLHQYLKNPDQFPGRVHIFLNAVKGIADAIKMANLTDCSIFCRDDKVNLENLDELKQYFKINPVEGSFSKFNFYTTKYFEGWDLEDENATMIVYSDIHKMSLRTGVSNKCVQAMGRNRKKSNRMIHLTNSRDILEFERFDSLVEKTFKTANATMESYAEHLKECKLKSCDPDIDIYKSVEKYCNIKESSDNILLNYYKVDRIINRDYSEQEYNHISFIKDAWLKSSYRVMLLQTYAPEIPKIEKRMKLTHKIRVIAQYLEHLSNTSISIEDYKFGLAELGVDFEYIIEYYKELGILEMERLEYEPILLRYAYRKSINKKAMESVAEDYFLKFGHSEVLTKQASSYLQKLYVEHIVIKEKGLHRIPKSASATHLKKMFAKVVSTKNSQKEHVWRIDIK